MQRHCEATTRLGEPCGFPPRKGTNLCINHAPGARTAEAAAHARAARTRSAEEFYKAGFTLDTRGAIQAVIDTVVRLVFAGRITDGSANTILRACAIASRNFDPTNLRRPQQLDWDDYNETRVGLLSTIDDLIFGPELDDPVDVAETNLLQLQPPTNNRLPPTNNQKRRPHQSESGAATD